ncbi:hypothetical protein [Novosphingobium sp. SG720]|uniref:hypothetical protein n=1 Tax=Novosphingobium sp. SG720 TaxID=2586998 RepID=UPI001448363C|nr:hypothetical protein [Novosphingobium sp. SG720]NKJ43190.1 hypothetical protein [Novosphingobium sp. SG720]
MGPFEVTKEMVRAVSDVLLRELLERLLMAEAKKNGILASGIEVGGNQIAADGGVDGAIEWNGSPEPGDWLPRRTVYFQCKAEAMAPRKLAKEMRPKGIVRPIFAELADKGGAYIIFSTDDPSKSAREQRLIAMRAALADVPGKDKVALDFYGADRVARWTNAHLGVAIWLLGQIGRPIRGWRPYGGWSAPEAETKPYLFDATVRVTSNGAETSIEAAINEIRSVLVQPGGVVRLIGISGMGKTRLAEALFDQRIDVGPPLAASRAIYGDAGLDLATSPALLAEQIAMSGTEAVIVVDNCAQRTHNQLAQIVGHKLSRASLLTIDYDIGSEQPLGRLVALGNNSEDILYAVLKQRFPQLTDAEWRHLAQFSGGNARIALKIAETGAEGGDLSKLNDSELVERLFQANRQEREPSARICAEAASLVYAFYTSAGDGHASEHGVLAGIAGVDADHFYRNIATFLDWGVTQQRGAQRAVMPPPLANMLAAPLIRRSDPESLLARFLAGPSRLFASFARRIGNLHDEVAAVRLAERMFGEGGALSRPELLSGDMQRAFLRAAPAAPNAALRAIERSLAGPACATLVDPNRDQRSELTQLLVLIAHDPMLFARAVEALLAFALAELPLGHDTAKIHLLERFSPVLSFTLADQNARLAFVDRLLGDPKESIGKIGVEALDQMLTTGHLSSSLNLEFGARQVLTEWRPPNGAGFHAWYEAAYQRLLKVAKDGGPHAAQARKIIAKHFRQHLNNGIGTLAFEAMRALQGGTYWEEGWRAVNDALHFSARRSDEGENTTDKELLTQLHELEQDFRPRTFDDLFETFVLGAPWRHWHPSGRSKNPVRNAGLLAQAVGRHLARCKHDPSPFIARAAVSQGQNSVWQFMTGLTRHSDDPYPLWAVAFGLFTASPEQVDPHLLGGIFAGMNGRDPDWVHAKLDIVADNPNLAPHLVRLHSAIPLDVAALRRFSHALEKGYIAPAAFEALMMGRATEPIPAADLASFLAELYGIDGGILPAIQVLQMRIFADRTDNRTVDPALIALGRTFLCDPQSYSNDLERHGHELAQIARTVLVGKDATDAAGRVCATLRSLARGKYRSYRDFHELCTLLMNRFPAVVLDEIVGQEVNDYLVEQFFGGRHADDDGRDGSGDKLDNETLLAWVAEAPEKRSVRVAELVPYFVKDATSDTLRWTPIALSLVDASPDPAAVLLRFERRFLSGAGWGPFSQRFVRRRPLVAALADHRDPQVRAWSRAAGERLEQSIRDWDARDHDLGSRFE